MYTPDDDSTPVSTAEAWSVLIFVMIVVGLFVADLATNYQPVKLSVLFVLILWIPFLVMHELGHALMAWLMGWHLERMVIGFGSVYWKFKLYGSPVDICQVPLSGYVIALPTNLRLPRIKDFLIYFGGPAMGLFLAAAMVAFAGPDRIFHSSDDYLVIFCQSVVLVGAFQGFVNLVPYFIITPTRLKANDGMGMILSFTRPTEHYQELVQVYDHLKSANPLDDSFK